MLTTNLKRTLPLRIPPLSPKSKKRAEFFTLTVQRRAFSELKATRLANGGRAIVTEEEEKYIHALVHFGNITILPLPFYFSGRKVREERLKLTMRHSPAMSAGCDSDDGGYGAHFQAEGDCDDDVRVYYDSLIPEVLGSGWFDQRLENLHQGIDITSGRSFFAVPRASDTQPSNIPARHPLRAIAWVLSQAPVNSTVRIYCYMLTDPFAIDLLINHGSNKTIQIILHTDNKSRNRLEEYFNDHGNIARRAFRDRLQVRIADTRRYNFTSMHDKSFITEDHCTFGSYNLSCPSRYQNWESVHVADSDQSQVEHFDQIWTSLANRDIQTVYPDLFPPSPSQQNIINYHLVKNNT